MLEVILILLIKSSSFVYDQHTQNTKLTHKITNVLYTVHLCK